MKCQTRKFENLENAVFHYKKQANRGSVKFTVEFSNFVSRVWAQILKRVVVRFYSNFNTMIWHLYVFILATWKNFPITEDFSRAKKRKNKAVFRNFETSVNLYEIFYVMKVVGKISVGIFHIGRIVYFHFRLFLEFSD